MGSLGAIMCCSASRPASRASSQPAPFRRSLLHATTWIMLLLLLLLLVKKAAADRGRTLDGGGPTGGAGACNAGTPPRGVPLQAAAGVFPEGCEPPPSTAARLLAVPAMTTASPLSADVSSLSELCLSVSAGLVAAQSAAALRANSLCKPGGALRRWVSTRRVATRCKASINRRDGLSVGEAPRPCVLSASGDTHGSGEVLLLAAVLAVALLQWTEPPWLVALQTSSCISDRGSRKSEVTFTSAKVPCVPLETAMHSSPKGDAWLVNCERMEKLVEGCNRSSACHT